MTLRAATATAIVVIVIGASLLFATRSPRGLPDGAPTEIAMATDIGAPVMEHVNRGNVPGRSGDIMLVPMPNNFLIGDWDLRTLGTDTPVQSTSHPNPWAYLTRVPIVIYGPGLAPRGLDVYDEVDIADLAPTYARLLRMDDFEAEGDDLPAIVDGSRPPKVIFTIVIDGGGWNVLQQHPDSWPEIARLRRGGTTYVNATIGSAPSITGALHATFGSGFYPRSHGLPGNQMRGPDGNNTDTWKDNADPSFLEVPTVSELWDEANDNEPTVATVSYEGWHLGMIGSGGLRPGGDKDIAVLWSAVDEHGRSPNEWWINEDYYTLPDYLETTDLAKLEGYEASLDARDGLDDGSWFGHRLDELRVDLTRPSTPAFARFTGDAVVDIIRNEGVGRDGLTDMFWVEMKMPDYAGHAWNMVGREQADVLAEVDAQIGRFRSVLDEVAGRGNYLIAISADHGQQPLPEATGGWRINSRELQRDIESRFGPVVQKVTPVDIYLDAEALSGSGYSADEIARYLGTYTLGDNVDRSKPGASRAPSYRFDELLFAGAFTTDFIQGLTPERIAGLGPGIYPEGNFLIEPGE